MLEQIAALCAAGFTRDDIMTILHHSAQAPAQTPAPDPAPAPAPDPAPAPAPDPAPAPAPDPAPAPMSNDFAQQILREMGALKSAIQSNNRNTASMPTETAPTAEQVLANIIVPPRTTKEV